MFGDICRNLLLVFLLFAGSWVGAVFVVWILKWS